MDPTRHPLPLSHFWDMKRVAETGARLSIICLKQRLDPDRSSCDACYASLRCMASKWSAEIGWIPWWRGQCFETRYMELSEGGIALFSAPCCFKTSVTGGNQDLVPAALRSSPRVPTLCNDVDGAVCTRESV